MGHSTSSEICDVIDTAGRTLRGLQREASRVGTNPLLTLRRMQLVGAATPAAILTVSNAEAQTTGMEERREDRRDDRQERREDRRDAREDRRDERRGVGDQPPTTGTAAPK
jgi:hypothetical protein